MSSFNLFVFLSIYLKSVPQLISLGAKILLGLPMNGLLSLSELRLVGGKVTFIRHVLFEISRKIVRPYHLLPLC